MTTQAAHTTQAATEKTTVIRSVEADAPLQWLAAGVRDFLATPGSSLLYGALFSLLAAGTIYLTWELPGFTFAFLTGLVLIGPVLAAGLYVAARQLASGEPASIFAALSLLRTRGANLALFGVFLALIMAWVRLSALLFALKFNSLTITLDGYLGVLSGTGDPVALAYFLLIGSALAVTVFVTSAVAIPMIVDRNCGPITAIQTSARAVAHNWTAMLVWAFSIVVLTVVGSLTLFLGMLVLFPILGYATWHSYRSLVE